MSPARFAITDTPPHWSVVVGALILGALFLLVQHLRNAEPLDSVVDRVLDDEPGGRP